MFSARAWLCVVVSLVIAAGFAYAESKKITADQTWTGSVANRELQGQPPTVITSAATWKAQWKTWQIGDAPEVDFGKHFVVVQTTVGSRLWLQLTLDDQGDLKVSAPATRDKRPGFRYVMATVAREGVKTVNGAALPAEEKAKQS